MLVIDASAAVEIVRDTRVGRRATETVERDGAVPVAPELVYGESINAIKGLERAGEITARRAGAAVSDLLALDLTIHPIAPLIPRAWELRHNFSTYDALYVALAEKLARDPRSGRVQFITADAPLAAATRVHTALEVVDLR